MKNIFLGIIILLFSGGLSAQEVKTKAKETPLSPMKRADALSVKASLENMLVQRYTQELSAFISEDHFNLGTRFELKKSEDVSSSSDSSYTDLDLGYLDADQLFDDYSIEGLGPLEKYSVKSIEVNVGLEPNMSEEVKTSVESWLEARVKEEFGAIGKTKVQYIQNPEVVRTPPLLKKIKDLQGLVGNVVLGLCIILGIILWRMLMGRSQGAGAEAAGGTSSVQIQSKTESTLHGGTAAESDGQGKAEESFGKQVDHLSKQIKELAPQIAENVQNLINEWCEKGEEGLHQLACFAEISGSVLGNLPIPAEYKKKMGGVFSKMHAMSNESRYEIVNRIYWDMVATLNLGVDALHRPFSFISSSAMGDVNKALLGNDVDTQTVVSMYMPESMRKNYFKDLLTEQKVELLNSAAKLSEITEDSLKSIEDRIAPYFSNNTTSEESVAMSLTLTKLIDVMSYVEACEILPTIEGDVIERFKQSEPHIAFLSQWEKESVHALAKQASNEQLLAYLRVVPSMKHYILEFSTPRVRQILEDDLNQEDTMQDVTKEEFLNSLNNLMHKMVSTGEINLYEAIKSDESDKKGLKLAA